ncbi:MAG TPA: YlbF family regulator [Bacilli bacterium]
MSEIQHMNNGVPFEIERYNLRDLVVKEDIMAKAKELAQMIYESEDVQMYRKAEQLIKENERVQSLIALIKKRQKEAVAFQHFQNPKMVEKIDGEIKELEAQLDAIPIVNQFRQTQDDLDYLLQMVFSVIRDSVSEKIAVEGASSPPPPASCSD